MTAFDERAYDAAWRWFELHARQRMELFRFYATVYVALLAGLGALWRFELRFEMLVLSLVGVVFCVVFQGLDRRTAELVKLAEKAMSVEQARLMEVVGYPEIELCRAADARPRKGRTYGRSVAAMNALMAFIFLAAALWTALSLAELL